MAKPRKVFYCTECGNELHSWQGQCPACHAWNTIVEAPDEAPAPRGASSKATAATGRATPMKLAGLDSDEESRVATGFHEFDRVLGGGAVPGSLILVGGAPGIGKSTLLLQICEELSRGHTVLYVSGEESERQIKMRAERLGVAGENVLLLTETDIGEVL
ncbi:MAG: AAA family ATPase, partial [Oscillospiraceae bacterium]|nr:AAA family ATPase [Oscillospiraceae bacterium]